MLNASSSSGGSGKKSGSSKVAAHQLQQEEGVRKIYIGDASAGHGENERQNFKSNYVSTTKYELWNIVPKNLLEQFQRAANFWFLTVSVFQMLPLELSPTNQYATILPLCGVIFVTFCKDAWEDQLRRRDDRRVNNQKCTVVEGSSQTPQLRQIRWKDVTVGSYIQLERDAPVPADMILLSSSNEDGVAYVDTAQLDGETSLKPKFALEETMRMLDHHELLNLQGHIDSEMPDELVQSFHATLFLRGHPRGVPVDAKNFLLRGSTLRNTKWIFGVVNFTGVDTKLVQNSKPTPSKRSHVEVLANRLLLIVFGVLIITAVLSAIARGVWLADGSTGDLQRQWVYPESDHLQDNKYLAIITFMIGYNNLIPISLYVTTDLVRTLQGLLMERDPSMYHAITDSFCRVRNSGLCENLGQVEFVLSDKTGTLTENKMSFKACCIGDRVYGCWDENHGPTNHVVALPPSDVCMPLERRLWSVSKPARKADRIDSEFEKIDDFFLCLATCHTAIVEELHPPPGSPKPAVGTALEALQTSLNNGGSRRNSGSAVTSSNSSRRNSGSGSRRNSRNNSDPGARIEPDGGQRWQGPAPELVDEAQRMIFRSSSPDEEALVAAARDHGYFFRKKVASRLVVNVRGEDTCYTVLATNEFTSDRKRMSVMVQRIDPDRCEDGASSSDRGNRPSAMLYVKGADNVMLERLAEGSESKKAAATVKNQLKRFASCGLRTLVLAKREIPADLADTLVQKVADAKGALMYRDRMMEEVADEMERHLHYLGITAIEDKIQQGVPKTINMLLRGGIKVWMLTGDNMETAINIGMACSLANSEMIRYMMDAPQTEAEKDPDAVEKRLESFYKDISRRLNRPKCEGPFQYCMIVHGEMLYVIEEHDRLRQLFLAIACSSSSVIACRLAPAQKATLVHLVRTNLEGNPLTLAIGDGGNDVSMIQEAHVGVGILGVEGRQAANASDFVIAQFRFLQQLLLVHGRWNLRRIGIVIGYSFYKNFTLVLPMVYYALYTGFSGTTLYDSYLLTCYNLFFTSLPILVMGVFDRDVSAKMALLVPSLYQLGIIRKYFNSWMLIAWIARGALHSLFIFWGVRVIFHGSMATPGGNAPDYLTMGSWGYVACVIVVNVTMLLHTKAWMDWYVLVVAGSCVIFLPMLLLYSQGDYAELLNEEMVGVGTCLFGRLGSWVGMLLIVSASSLCDLAEQFARKVFFPDAADILQEVQLGYLSGTNAGIFADIGADDDEDGIVVPHTIPPAYVGDESGKTKDDDSEAGLDDDSDDGKARTRLSKPSERSETESDVPPPYVTYLHQLPCPPSRLHQVKPLGDLYLEPLMPDSGRPKTAKTAGSKPIRVCDASSKNAGMSAVVPTPLQSQGSHSSLPSWSDNPISTFTQRRQGMLARIYQLANQIYSQAWQQQWSKMTVGDLLASLGRDEYSKIMESKHVKNGNGTGVVQPKGVSNDRDSGHFSSASSSTSGATTTAMSPSPTNEIQTPPFSSGSFHPGSTLEPKDSKGKGTTPMTPIPSAGVESGLVGDAEMMLRQQRSLDSQASIATAETHTEVVKDLIYSIVTLRFLSVQQEASFRQYFSSQSLLMFQKSIVVLCACLISYNLYGQIVYGSERPLILRIILIVMIILGGAVTSYFLHTGFVRAHAESCIIAFILVIISIKHGYDVLAESDGILGNSYLPVFIMAGARIRITSICPVLIFHMLALLIHYWIGADRLEVSSDYEVLDSKRRLQAEYFVLMIGITFLNFYYAYLIEKLMRQDFIVLFSLERSKKQAMEILKNIFPEEVVNHVISDIQRRQEATRSSSSQRKALADVKSIREACGIVTVLFCDITDFDNLVETLDPRELVQMLDQVWQAFDRVCQQQTLTKIETVGKTYMAAAMGEGRDAQTEEKIASRVMHALMTAQDMLDQVEKRVLGVSKSVTNVSVKIGIHTGNAMCGVVGSRKPQFALFGDTVNTASRMCSTGEKNKVHVSDSTYARVAHDTRFTWKPIKTQVKGKGLMDTYLLMQYAQKARRRSNGGSEERPTPVMTPKTSVDTSMTHQERPLPVPTMSCDDPGTGSQSLSSGNKTVSWGKRAEANGGSTSPRRRSSGGGSEKNPSPPRINVTAPQSPREGPPLLQTADQDADAYFGEEPPSRGNSGCLSRSNSEKANPRRLSGQMVSSLLGTAVPEQQEAPVNQIRAESPVAITECPDTPTVSMLVKKVPSAHSGSTVRSSKTTFRSLIDSRGVGGVADMWNSASSLSRIRRKLFRQLQGNSVQHKTQQELALNSQDIKSILVSLQSFLACYFAESFCLLVGRQGRECDNPMVVFAIRAVYFAATLLISVLLYSHGRRMKWDLRFSKLGTFFSDVVSVIIFAGFVCSTVTNTAFLPVGSEFWNVFEAFFFVMVLMHMYRLNLQGVVPVISGVLVIVVTVVATAAKRETVLMLECIVYSLLMAGTQTLAVHGDPRRFRDDHRAHIEEHDRVNELLDSMLPREVLSEMKSGTMGTAYNYQDMTFLFADIVGFTSYCASHTAEEAVNLVTRLFAEFDESTVELQIYKVCTIGDAYVVVNEPRTKVVDKHGDCERVYRLADKMIKIIIRVRGQVQHDSLDMRIGLHCGNFVGGVIGTTRVRFDIWGQDVIIGNSVESEGKAGRICASEQAKQVLENCPIGSKLTFTFNKDFELKNKRTIRSYVVDSEDDGFAG